MNPQSQWFLIAGCGTAGLTVFAAIYPLTTALFAPQTLNVDRWNRSRTRWAKLHKTSPLFRLLQHPVIGIGYLIQTRLGWLIHVPGNLRGPAHLAALTIGCLLGKPRPLQRATGVVNTVTPWSVGEVIAAGWFVAAAIALALPLLVFGFSGPATYFGQAATTWLLTYRLYRWHFIRTAGQRRSAIAKFLPHAMDTIAMVVATGDSFRFGLETVIRDYPDEPLSQEFSRLCHALQRGQTMREALHEITENIGLPEFDELQRVLGRMHQHGAPATTQIGKLAKQLRQIQLRQLEEQVGRSEATMTLPTFLVLVACMLVATAPFLLSAIDQPLLP